MKKWLDKIVKMLNDQQIDTQLASFQCTYINIPCMQINAKSYWIFCRSSKCIDSGENISQFCPLLFVSANLFLCISRTPLKTLLAQMTSFAELTIAFFFLPFLLSSQLGQEVACANVHHNEHECFMCALEAFCGNHVFRENLAPKLDCR